MVKKGGETVTAVNFGVERTTRLGVKGLPKLKWANFSLPLCFCSILYIIS